MTAVESVECEHWQRFKFAFPLKSWQKRLIAESLTWKYIAKRNTALELSAATRDFHRTRCLRWRMVQKLLPNTLLHPRCNEETRECSL